MKKVIIYTILILLGKNAFATTPAQALLAVYQKFQTVKNFKAKLQVRFDIPSINIPKMSGQVAYKVPDKFKIKLTGVAFLPKQNPFETFQFLRDTNTYVAVTLPSEHIGKTKCEVITVLPKNDQDIIMEKLWIDPIQHLIMKAEVSSKANGLVKSEYFYNTQTNWALPDKILFSIDVNRFQLPKMIAVDLNSKRKTMPNSPRKEVGKIEFLFNQYSINKGVSATDF